MKKLKKRLRHLEYDLRDEIWIATHPEPLFKKGDKVYYYENPTATIEPEGDPRIKVTIELLQKLKFCPRKKDSMYYPPQRWYWAIHKGKTIEVQENNCTFTNKP